MKENRAFRTSLACLQHPVSLLCIGLLLLNDHVLKTAIPSWLTGKLSDFAGLFFFPFIMAAGLSLLFGRSRLDSEQIGYLSFGIVAAWFAALKTLPAANALTAQFAGILLGTPCTFALDATDLMALLALWPAWILWNRQESESPRRVAYLALCAGAIAATATSPAAMPTSIERFGYQDGVVYAANYGGILESRDSGMSWDYCDASCRDLSLPTQPPTLPISVCDPDSPKTCYRITGSPNIETSSDGGKTWSIAWEVPRGRIPYLGRDAGSAKAEDIMPRDLVIVPGSRSYLLAAMGKAGILRRSLPDGEWQRIRVGYSLPVAYTSPDFSSGMMNTALELGMWMLISVGLIIVTGSQLWIARPEGMSLFRLGGWMLLTIGSAVGAVILVLAVFIMGMFLVSTLLGNSLPGWMNSSDFVFGVAATLIYAALFLAFQWSTGSIVTKLVQDTKAQQILLSILFSMAAANCLASVAVWPLWAMGIIWDYNTALFLAGGATLILLATGALLVRGETARFESL